MMLSLRLRAFYWIFSKYARVWRQAEYAKGILKSSIIKEWMGLHTAIYFVCKIYQVTLPNHGQCAIKPYLLIGETYLAASSTITAQSPIKSILKILKGASLMKVRTSVHCFFLCEVKGLNDFPCLAFEVSGFGTPRCKICSWRASQFQLKPQSASVSKSNWKKLSNQSFFPQGLRINSVDFGRFWMDMTRYKFMSRHFLF